MEYILSMTFNTEGGKSPSLSINGVKSNIRSTGFSSYESYNCKKHL